MTAPDRPYLPGERVRFTLGPLGIINSVGTVDQGETGTVIGPTPEREGWLYVEPDSHPEHVCPVAPNMIKRA